MARIRTVKPEFFTSEDITALSPLARLLYIALWCEADKEGRMVWKPKTFRLRYLPADECDVVALCDELTKGGLVKLYGDGLAYIPAFADHQHINPRESASCLPAPDASPRVRTRQARVPHAQGGREGKGREGKTNVVPEVALMLMEAGVDSVVVADFNELRHRHDAPLTVTALKGIQREATKAGLTLQAALEMSCERGWRGFKAEWLVAKDAKGKPIATTDAFAGAL